MSVEGLRRIPGCWREAEAEENAADLSDYLRRVLWRLRHVPELLGCLERFEACVKGLDVGCIEHADIQYLRQWLVRMELRGTVRRGLPDYELALDRLNSIECGSFAPLHRDRLFDAADLADLESRMAGLCVEQEFPYLSAIGFKCDCPRRMVIFVIHDGTPVVQDLTGACEALFHHACETTRSVPAEHFGRFDSNRSRDRFIDESSVKVDRLGFDLRGPYCYRKGGLHAWVHDDSEVTP
ncbi:hypothetical protein [Allorhodopirellula heiligendammensis]|uniref:Uncharacterized protein n=1 Tax=Allorhodopirellula heiligendammensis TaxID=2714739 RepID=A0A5C6BV14_9BACT|nr:hypothetical protein [Allorhodopirellula heiligendammensis]TWU15056.1 hypothetical protein Poly21_22470 [Allorhodopirellula heiligendammensis]